MTTIADELLNDFEDSGSEAEEENREGFQDDGLDAPGANGTEKRVNPVAERAEMQLDEDEEMEDEEDEEGLDGPLKPGAEAEDEAEAKARVEKMQLAGVSDVRSVAVLMKTLDPLLEVSFHILSQLCTAFTS